MQDLNSNEKGQVLQERKKKERHIWTSFYASIFNVRVDVLHQAKGLSVLRLPVEPQKRPIFALYFPASSNQQLREFIRQR